MYKYKLAQKIGSGSFGDVFIAHHTQTNQTVAIKLMKQQYNDWNECLQLRQIKSLLKLKHQSIIALKEVFQTEGKLCLVFEYAESNLYERYLKVGHTHQIAEPEIKNIARQLAEGLAYMHRNGFFHRDLKPENILIANKSQYKICDFGLARQIRSFPPYTAYVSTRWYRSPELVLRMTNYNSPVDIFAFGCILAQLYNGSPLFPGTNEADQLQKIFGVMGTPSQSQWPDLYKWAAQKKIKIPEVEGIGLRKVIQGASGEAVGLIEGMLQMNPKNRITAQNILKHPYLSDTIYTIKPQQTQTKNHKKKSSKNEQKNSLQEFLNDDIVKQENKGQQQVKAAQNLELSNLIRQLQAKTQKKKILKTQVQKSNFRYESTQPEQQPQDKNPLSSQTHHHHHQTKFLVKKPLSKPWGSVANLQTQQIHRTASSVATRPIKQQKASIVQNQYFQGAPETQRLQNKRQEFRGRKLISVEKNGKKKEHFRTEKEGDESPGSRSSSESLNFLKYKFDPNKKSEEPTPKKLLSQLKVPLPNIKKL